MHTQQPPEENAATIALYFAACMCVCGLFVFGFCKMFQPRQIPNLGLAAYEPFPATVIHYPAASNRFTYAAVDGTRDDTLDETSGQAMEVVDVNAPPTQVRSPMQVEHANHPARPPRSAHTAKAHEPTHHVERSASSRAQAESHGRGATFQGYAMLH
jgi:hypothetical protein